ncbi:MAG: Flp1 family type IVb pilin [Eubacteriales bacterium]|nr:Flp1 family type IVb pilin [Eubacteriales bacterium]
MKTVDKVFTEEDGVGTIEIVLILVVLIALVYIFKDRLNSLIMQVFSQIDDTAKKIY